MSLLFPSETRADGPFTILTVCTGNICRSPLTEQLFRKTLANLQVRVFSAGTNALVGQPMQPQNQLIAAELGVTDGDTHKAQQITIDMLREADLILTLAREHRRATSELFPRSNRRTFTLREFARLSQAVEPEDIAHIQSGSTHERMRDVVEVVSQLRGTLPLLDDPLDDDVVDPYRQEPQLYRQSEQQIVPAVNAVTQLLRSAAKGYS